MKRVVVTGAAGMIGHHLCAYLKKKGNYVLGVDINRCVDTKGVSSFAQVDLRDPRNALRVFKGADEVYALAALNGSIEYTSKEDLPIVENNTLVNLNTAQACHWMGVRRVFFSSSACVYPIGLQGEKSPSVLTEDDAYPANPDSEYGWEKLYAERIYTIFSKNAYEMRIARFFNVYGPEGHLNPILSKAPMALCKKIYDAKELDEIKIWGADGKAVRSFLYIDDCLEGIDKIMHSDSPKPFNLGTKEHMSVNQLVDTISEVANKKVIKVYDKTRAQGVRNRLCDFSRIERELKWQPKVSFTEGIRRTYEWVKSVS